MPPVVFKLWAGDFQACQLETLAERLGGGQYGPSPAALPVKGKGAEINNVLEGHRDQ